LTGDRGFEFRWHRFLLFSQDTLNF
jgi:hypothetical protein